MKPFKVLSIDGGGIKGLYAATILAEVELALQQREGPDVRLVDFVDLICGTSTGGLIALALALRIPASRVCAFYEQHGPAIFRGSHRLPARVRQIVCGGKFSDRVLRAALVEMFQTRTIGESDCLLCIPTYDVTHGTYGIFKFDHPEGQLVRHNKLSMVDVALATSAAPTFFPLAQIGAEHNTQYIDGGVWANNPSLVGYLEASRYFVGAGKAYDHLTLLSISALSVGSGKSPGLRRRRSFAAWGADLFEPGLVGQSEFADVFMQFLTAEPMNALTYLRIPSPPISREQARFIQLDLADRRSLDLMKQFARQMYHHYRMRPGLMEFFATRKTYRTHSSVVQGQTDSATIDALTTAT
jgi:uncharacterized protein